MRRTRRADRRCCCCSARAPSRAARATRSICWSLLPLFLVGARGREPAGSTRRLPRCTPARCTACCCRRARCSRHVPIRRTPGRAGSHRRARSRTLLGYIDVAAELGVRNPRQFRRQASPRNYADRRLARRRTLGICAFRSRRFRYRPRTGAPDRRTRPSPPCSSAASSS